ncbi:MAG: endonuclease/exonuclease/phosphatase family protein [Bacteroidetes bacterium]|nr:endonuclease/exonuclease/phosphatase family protein [Bacteroidota bacterium]
MGTISSLGRKVAETITTPLSLVIALLLVLSATAQYFNPLQVELMPFLGLFFPVFFLLNIFFLVLLAILGKRTAFLSLFLSLALSPVFLTYIGKNQTSTESDFKLLTFNVHGFRGQAKDSNRSDVATGIANLIRDSGATMVCLQEFRSWTGDIEQDISMFAGQAGYPHYSYTIYWPKGGSNSDIHLIISRHPILRSGPVGARTGRNIGHYADLATDLGVIRMVGLHLVSFSLDKQEIEMLGQADFLNRENARKHFPRLSSKLVNTFRIRAFETQDLLTFINKSPLPLVLAGDFNDTPASYTYHKLRRAGFTDAHSRSGHGIGATYAGRIPLLRIDYVFLSPAFESRSSTVLPSSLSDHYPVVVTFAKRTSAQD